MKARHFGLDAERVVGLGDVHVNWMKQFCFRLEPVIQFVTKKAAVVFKDLKRARAMF